MPQVLTISFSKLADWSDDDTAAMKQTSSRFDKVVVLKHMFTLKELEVLSPSTKYTKRTSVLLGSLIVESLNLSLLSTRSPRGSRK